MFSLVWLDKAIDIGSGEAYPGSTQVKECMEYLLKLAFVDPKRGKDEEIKHLGGLQARINSIINL